MYLGDMLVRGSIALTELYFGVRSSAYIKTNNKRGLGNHCCLHYLVSSLWKPREKFLLLVSEIVVLCEVFLCVFLNLMHIYEFVIQNNSLF